MMEGLVQYKSIRVGEISGDDFALRHYQFLLYSTFNIYYSRIIHSILSPQLSPVSQLCVQLQLSQRTRRVIRAAEDFY